MSKKEALEILFSFRETDSNTRIYLEEARKLEIEESNISLMGRELLRRAFIKGEKNDRKRKKAPSRS